MILKELEMQNFRSHKETKILFENGTTVIVGDNGSGKTSILEAIHYAFYKKPLVKHEDLIRNGENHMKVTLRFVAKGREYVVERRRDNNTATSVLITPETVIEGNKTVDSAITEILGMGNEMFLNALYIRQGEITSLLGKTSSERKKMIGRLLNIECLERAYAGMGPVIREHENRLIRLRESSLQKRMDTVDIEQVKTETEKLEKSLDLNIAETEDAKNEKENIEKRIGEDASLIVEDNANRKLFEANLTKIKSLKDEMSELEREWGKLSEIQQRINQVKTELDGYNIEHVEHTIESNNSLIRIIEHENRTFRKSIAELENADGVCPICDSEIDDMKRDELIGKNENKILVNLDIRETLERENTGKRQLLDEYRTKVFELEKLEERRENCENAKTEHDKIGNEKRGIEEENRLLSDEMRRNQHITVRYNANKSLLRETENRLHNLMEEHGTLKALIRNNKKTITELENKTTQADHTDEEIRQTEKYMETLERIRNLFDRKGLQQSLRESAKPTIEKHANEYFTRFNFNYEGFTLDTDYTPTFHGLQGECHTGMLSGGEKVAAAIAIRLGITKAISKGEIECILLDEPTMHLDHERVREMANIFRDMRIAPQIIIVTHDNEMETIADKVIKLNKSGGTSETI